MLLEPGAISQAKAVQQVIAVDGLNAARKGGYSPPNRRHYAESMRQLNSVLD
jgi:hypothetical protein